MGKRLHKLPFHPTVGELQGFSWGKLTNNQILVFTLKKKKFVCCCCGFRKSLVTVRLMIFQTAILQPIIQFISAVLWADDKYERVGVSYRFPALGSRLFSLVPHNLIKPWPWPCWCDPTSGIDNCSRKLRAPVYDILPSLLGWRCRKAMFWECYDPIIMGIDKYSLKLQARHPSKGAGKRGLECDAVSACTLRTDSVSTSYLEAAYIKPLI